MGMKFSHLLLAVIVPVGLLGIFSVLNAKEPPAAVAKDKAAKAVVAFPVDYQKTFTNYLSLDRTQNDDQIIRLFANDIAMKGPDETGGLPFGSVLVAEVYKAKLDENKKVVTSELGRRIRDTFALVAVMEKGEHLGKGYPEELDNGNWEYGAFKPDGSLAGKDLNSCRECHAPQKKMDYLFSMEHFPRANAGK